MGNALYRVADLRRLAEEATRTLPARTLMQRAGAAAAEFIARGLDPATNPVLVLCGPGNNGGDGYEAAAGLRERGFATLCVALAPPDSEDARAAQSCYRAAGGQVTDTLPAATPPGTCLVDAMFGIGLARALAGSFLAAARWLERQKIRVVALDVPSGLDADTGAWVGGVAGVRADATLTFLAAKPGLHTHAGCDTAGLVEVANLGVELPPSALALNDPEWFSALVARRHRDTHKGRYGVVQVIGGGTGMVGAALLAARAALRLGAGRVFVDCVGAPELRCDPMQPELMFRPASSVREACVRVVGCGLGVDADAALAVAGALAQEAPLVLDADALNLISTHADLAARLRARDAAAVTVLTPHPLEAARLLGVSVAEIQTDRVAATLRLAIRFHAIVVLKGAGSIVASPAVASRPARAWINPTGGPALATPGSGDVLAGILAALLAQGYPAIEAVLGAVWLHGTAADRFGADVGLVAGELPALAVGVLADLRRQPSD